MTPCGTGQCVDVCSEREVSQLAPHTALHYTALDCTTAAQNAIHLAVHVSVSEVISLSCPATPEFMIFIPLGMLDKLPLSPRINHFMGLVSFSLTFLNLTVW